MCNGSGSGESKRKKNRPPAFVLSVNQGAASDWLEQDNYGTLFTNGFLADSNAVHNFYTHTEVITESVTTLYIYIRQSVVENGRNNHWHGFGSGIHANILQFTENKLYVACTDHLQKAIPKIYNLVNND